MDDNIHFVDFPKHGGGGSGGDGGDMYTRERLARLEATDELRERNIRGIESELKSINQNLSSMEKRFIDKIDDNQKWLVGLLVSAILVPLFIALVTK
ncbi:MULTISPECIES: hemolysin XhlA family protein [Enterobacteriaceae]|nr:MULTISPECIES: hemolysin XhlA family protein [Enterobacteriaceae]MCL9499484.1 hemolysin XhlA family protein [Salmonella enterica subsp. enterica serovar Enteritidis]MCL9514623.1 hemolysin XhlA family protein [Salmonella enterica subsp. enterica serovar Enteritidis]MCN0296462.1 hemolysin XhlA family protein [Salmonella enterica]MCW6689744.1 hemolysin XhlA family protein [Salmonella enterica subsp. enterica serovar Potsdam]MCW6703445.1 hemolysin XhlA family protein [Salmonella enterica subsp. 